MRHCKGYSRQAGDRWMLAANEQGFMQVGN